MPSESSAAKEYDEPVRKSSDAGRAVLAETVDAERKREEAVAGDINTADEVTGIKLGLIVVALCFSNMLTGLVSRSTH